MNPLETLYSALSWLTGSGAGQSPPPPPPKVVLVPPFFQRDVRGLSRFCHSSYDYLANRKQLEQLLRDHLQPNFRGKLLLSPPDDPRVSVRAKLKRGGGSMVLRWQPAAPHSFLELAAGMGSSSDVMLRGSWVHEGSGLGAFAVLPLTAPPPAGAAARGAAAAGGAGSSSCGEGEDLEAAQVGLRYTSTRATAGAVFCPRTGQLDKAWLAGRLRGFTFGLQLSPHTPVRQLWQAAVGASAALPKSALRSRDGSGAPAAAAATATTTAPQCHTAPLLRLSGRLVELFGSSWFRSRSSVLLSYSPLPSAATPGRPSFTATVEVTEGGGLAFSFMQHVAATRQVVNPFEEDEVVGITNYLDIGLQLTTAITAPSGIAAAAARATTTTAAGDGGKATSAPAGPSSSSCGRGSRSSGGGDGGGSRLPAAVNLAASWQINKNWLLKARVGSDSAAAAVGARVWPQALSAYLTATASIDYVTRKPRYGAELCVENFGPLRYERGADDVAAGRALLQRHEASQQERDNREGRGPLVRRTPVSDPAAAARRQRQVVVVEEERRRAAQLM